MNGPWVGHQTPDREPWVEKATGCELWPLMVASASWQQHGRKGGSSGDDHPDPRLLLSLTSC